MQLVPLHLGRAQCGELLLGDNPVGRARRTAVAEMCSAAGRTLRLQFPTEDLGFTYPAGGGGGGGGGAMKGGSGGWARTGAGGGGRGGGGGGGVSGASAALHPPGSLAVGARLPHAWLTVCAGGGGVVGQPGAAAAPGGVGWVVVTSSLDLTEPCVLDSSRAAAAAASDGRSDAVGSTLTSSEAAAAAAAAAALGESVSGVLFTVVAPLGDDGGVAADERIAALRRDAPPGVSIRLVLVAPSLTAAAAAPAASAAAGDGLSKGGGGGEREDEGEGGGGGGGSGGGGKRQLQIRVVVVDRDGAWRRAAAGGTLDAVPAVLVRPDGHVAWTGAWAYRGSGAAAGFGPDDEDGNENEVVEEGGSGVLGALRHSLGW
jgi:hypothetical protein